MCARVADHKNPDLFLHLLGMADHAQPDHKHPEDTMSRRKKPLKRSITKRSDGAHSASDQARDDRLVEDLQQAGASEPFDRHQQRLTAVEPEEDGLHEDDLDDERSAEELRTKALQEQDDDPNPLR